MNATQRELFKRTCFGQFFEMREMRLRHQVIHKFLLIEVRQSTHVEMWFKVAGKHLMFSVEEFALASGLACQGDDNTNEFKIGHSRIKHLFFKHKKNVYMKDVENTFNNLTAATSDKDVVRLGALYLISSFPYTTTSANVVPHEYFQISESPYMDTFSWGKELFQITYMYLKLALAKTNAKLEDPKGILSYRLHGFPLAF
ncbi:Hypothetical predicted protein [Olea europaea subsp. europaea]|uniref:DUF1985 domain-containing protein n=1 Tax=Olea europaea subsp. europaea TaxID=158383 RepID=A0A8S0PU78_OLEEU|nr:Hypothetical predicted protein [Olea europaea subsp. europaea]